eukprot:c16320_g1_i2.p1 GENE.c16320_g1_i2~~c16320_g1_i2.p1  ORF type:complete len:100 (+),score=36.36 c16320_g1_i2:40-339(+)
MSHKIKLTYFKDEGSAEATRLAFVVGKIPFEDIRVTEEEWANVKPTAKFGQAPFMDLDGQQFAQSTALLRFAAKLAGLYPQDPLDALKIDEVKYIFIFV